jgi:hypothetical protein
MRFARTVGEGMRQKGTRFSVATRDAVQMLDKTARSGMRTKFEPDIGLDAAKARS